MDIDIKTALSERLSRIRALNRGMQADDLDARDIAHLQALLDTEINAAISDLEAAHA